MTLDETQNATFAGDVEVQGGKVHIKEGTSGNSDLPSLVFDNTDTSVSTGDMLGSIAFIQQTSSHTGTSARIYSAAEDNVGGEGIVFQTGDNDNISAALTLNKSQNATFSGNVTTGGEVTIKGASGADAALYITSDAGEDWNDKTRIRKGEGADLYIELYNGSDWEKSAEFITNDAVKLNFDGAVHFETTANGAELSNAADNKVDLKFHYSNNSGYSLVQMDNANNLILDCDPTGAGSDSFIQLKVDGSEVLKLDSKATFAGSLEVKGHGDISTTGSTAHNYAYGRGSNPAGISIYGEEASFELVASDLSTHAGSILFRHHNNKGFGFVHNGTDETLELKAFTSSADNFSIHGTGSQVSSLVTVLTAASDGDVTFKGDVGIPDNVLSVNTTDDYLEYNSNQTAVVTIDTGAGSNSSAGPAQDMASAINNVGSTSWGIGMQNISGSALGISLQFIDEGGDGCGYISQGNSGTTYSTSSDYRIKENAVDITDGITRLKQLKPYRFNFKKVPDKTVDGFFAHEAQTVVPEAVTGTKDEVDSDGKAVIQGIDQAKLVPLLVASLQEAIAKIEVLETEVAALKAGS